MLSPRLGRIAPPLLFALLTAAPVATSCGGSSGAAIGPAGDASSDGVQADGGGASSSSGGGSGSSSGGGGSSGDDGAASEDGGVEVTEGGSNPDLDGGDDGGDDTAPDGGECNTLVNAAPSVTSVCASEEPALTGGALVAGTYYLTGVTTYGSANFCKTEFVPVGIKETATMTVTGGIGSAETVLQLATNKERRTTVTLTPGQNGASPLTEATTCPAAGAIVTAKYEAKSDTAKTVLVLRLAYGKGEADYTFQKP